MDTASIIMFMFVPIIALIFSVTALMGIHVNDLYDFLIGFFSSLIATVAWGIFALLWPVVATEAMYVPISYLWLAFSVTFLIFVFIYIVLYITVATDPTRKQEAALTLH